MGKKEKKEAEKVFEAFFSGLPYEATEENLKEFLGSEEGIISIKMPRYQDTNRCRGYAHIKFDNEEAYNSALSKNGQNLGTRYLKIEPAKGERVEAEPTIPVGCKSLFVKGLPYDITEEELKKEFESCGAVKDVRMVRNSVNRNFKGFIYVDFKEPSSLKKAVKKYHNQLFRGRKLVCDASVTGMKKGFKKREPRTEQHGNEEDEE